MEENLENLKFNYIRNRGLMYDMNLEHDKNIESVGHCHCLDIRRDEYRREGKSEEEIDDIFNATNKWGREDHIHTLCLSDLNSDNFKLYYQVKSIYGINHSDLSKLSLTSEEIIWLLKANNKWQTIDKGLCWSCGKKPIELLMDNFPYCYECAIEILKDRKESFSHFKNPIN